MPMFYIGHTTVKKVELGYRGSVTSKKYKDIWKEEIKNNDIFKTIILKTFTTREEALNAEESLHSKLKVHKNPMYINQATAKGTFYISAKGKNNPQYGSNKTGSNNPMFGRTHSKEAREKMSKSGKGKHSQPKKESHKKSLSIRYKGRTWEEVHGIEKANEMKKNLQKPKSEEHKASLKEARKKDPRFTCIHCNLTTIKLNFTRWHGDNCKLFTKKVCDESQTILLV